MQITRKKLSELHKIENNIRRHSENQIAEYVRSIKQFGQVRPLVVDENGTIIIGNGLFEALIDMGATEADCYVVTGLSEAKKKKLMIADNRVFELGTTDFNALTDVVTSLDGDFDIPGFDDETLEFMVVPPITDTFNDEIMDYGRPVEVQEYEPQPLNVGTYRAEATSEPYAEAPVPPPTLPPTEAEESHANIENNRFVICPNCGEKIWL